MASLSTSPEDRTTGVIESELSEFLHRLAEKQTVLWRRIEREVADEVRAGSDESVRSQLDTIGISALRLVELWDRKLRVGFRHDVPPERVLCGFNSVADVVLQLETSAELDDFVNWVAVRAGVPPADLIADVVPKVKAYSSHLKSKSAAKPSLLNRVQTPSEMLEALLVAMLHPDKEWKPALERDLWEQVRQYVYDRDHEFRMGGASGNMAYVLSHLGVDTTAHWLHHPKELALDASGRLRRMQFDANRLGANHKVEESAELDGTYKLDRGAPQPDPVRRSFVFGFAKGLTLSGSGILATDYGRVIYIAWQHLSDGPSRGWSRVKLRTVAPSGARVDAELDDIWVRADLKDNGWPFFPVFARKYVEDDSLVVEIASEQAMEQVAEQVDYFMLGGIQNLPPVSVRTVGSGGKSSGPSARTIVQHALARQLAILARRAVVIHWEIGGITDPGLLDELAALVQGRVKSAGLNHTELATITGGQGFVHTRYHLPLPTASAQTSDVLLRYQQAVHLARQLDLDELYVHGNDVDLLVRRRTTRGALREEIAATLFAKGIVLLTLLKRSLPDWKSHIRHIKVPPVLKAEGFIQLFRLAKELAMLHFPGNQCLEAQTFKDIITSGYYFERDPEEYSVMIVPVMWPDLQIPFSTAGAGDICSSVVAVYSGK